MLAIKRVSIESTVSVLDLTCSSRDFLPLTSALMPNAQMLNCPYCVMTQDGISRRCTIQAFCGGRCALVSRIPELKAAPLSPPVTKPFSETIVGEAGPSRSVWTPQTNAASPNRQSFLAVLRLELDAEDLEQGPGPLSLSKEGTVESRDQSRRPISRNPIRHGCPRTAEG